MNSEFMIDTYAWVEYFAGSETGRKVKNYIEGHAAATPTIVVAELSAKLRKEILDRRETDEGRSKKLEFVKSSTEVVGLDGQIATQAGELDVLRKRVVKNWGLADSIVLATARGGGARVVTGDKHFADLKEVVYVAASRA